MAAFYNMTRKLTQLTVGKRLILGFSLTLLLTVLVAGTGMGYFKTIKTRSERIDFSHELSDVLSKSRYNRALFGQTYNPQYLESYQQNLQDLLKLLKEGQSLNWDEESREELKRLSVLFSDFEKTHKEYEQAILVKEAINKKGDLSMVQEELKQLEKRFSGADSLSSDSHLQLAFSRLDHNLTYIRYLTRGLVLKPSLETEKPIFDAITQARRNAATLFRLLPVEQSPRLKMLLDTLEGYHEIVASYRPAYEKEVQISQEIRDEAEVITKQVNDFVENELKQIGVGINQAQWRMGIVTLIAIISGLLVAWRITLKITGPLRDTLENAQRIATGDLREVHRSERSDELGQLLNAVAAMSENLHVMIGKIKQSVGQVSLAVADITVGNTELSVRTEQQAAAVTETAASMEELTATVKQNADNAHHANQLASDASAIARQGGEQVNDAVATMREISSGSQRIAEITTLINSIAFQTNILALNAAVEAARAGEQGRGFAVVAGEVRNLASRCAEAAKEIDNLINESVNQVQKGTSLVEGTGETMHKIVQAVSSVCDIMSDITIASDEQTRGIDQIGQAIVEMDSTTQQNAAMVEQSSTATNSLNNQTEILMKSVAVFQLDEGVMPAPAKNVFAIHKAVPVKSVMKVEDTGDWDSF